MDRQTHTRRRTDRHAHRKTPRSHIGGGVTKSHATFHKSNHSFDNVERTLLRDRRTTTIISKQRGSSSKKMSDL